MKIALIYRNRSEAIKMLLWYDKLNEKSVDVHVIAIDVGALPRQTDDNVERFI